MTGKEYMHQIKICKRKIRLLEEQIERDTTLAQGVGAIRYDKVNVQTSPIQDRMTDIVQSIIEATEELKKELRKLQGYEYEVRTYLLQLDEKYERILSLHYLDDMSWCLVAERLGYDDVYIYDLKNKALDELTKVLKDNH